MTKRADAGPYARALLRVCLEQNSAERAAQELDGFAALAKNHPALAASLANPAVTPSAKRNIVVELCERMGYQPVVRNVLALLAERGRFGLLDALVAAYRTGLREAQQAIDAEVISAVPLSPEHAQALAESLSTATGKRVTLSTKVDASLLGGVVARVGSVVYDGSVLRQLERIREELHQRA